MGARLYVIEARIKGGPRWSRWFPQVDALGRPAKVSGYRTLAEAREHVERWCPEWLGGQFRIVRYDRRMP
jgi:hypothetical protein